MFKKKYFFSLFLFLFFVGSCSNNERNDIEDALKKAERLYQIQYIEKVKGGVIVISTRDDNKPNTYSVEIAYVKKTWLGWKWEWGGGYMGDIPEGLHGEYIAAHNESPVIYYGHIQNPKIVRVKVLDIDKNVMKMATVVKVTNNRRIWFTLAYKNEELYRNDEKNLYFIGLSRNNEAVKTKKYDSGL